MFFIGFDLCERTLRVIKNALVLQLEGALAERSHVACCCYSERVYIVLSGNQKAIKNLDLEQYAGKSVRALRE
jgi:hypothetical protein